MNKRWISVRNLMWVLIVALMTMATYGCSLFALYPSLETSPGRAETNKLEYTDHISGFSFVNLPDGQGGTTEHMVFIGQRNDYVFDKLYKISLFRSPKLNPHSMSITNMTFFSADFGEPAKTFEGFFFVHYYFDDSAMTSPDGKYVVFSARGIEQKIIEEEYNSTCVFSPCSISISDVAGKIYVKNFLKFKSDIFLFKETFQMNFFSGYQLKKKEKVDLINHGFKPFVG